MWVIGLLVATIAMLIWAQRVQRKIEDSYADAMAAHEDAIEWQRTVEGARLEDPYEYARRVEFNERAYLRGERYVPHDESVVERAAKVHQAARRSQRDEPVQRDTPDHAYGQSVPQ